MNNQTQDTNLSPDEIKNFIYNPPQNPQNSKTPDLENLSKFEKVENPKFPFFSRSIPKLLIIGLFTLPIFSFLLFVTSDFGSHKTVGQTLSDSSNSEMESDNELLSQQVDELQVEKAVLLQDFEELQAKKNKVKVVKTKPEAQVQVEPQPDKLVKQEASQDPQTVPVIDPYEEWDKYANLGVINGDGFTEEEEGENQNLESETKAAALSPSNRENDDGILGREAQNALFGYKYDKSFLESKRREFELQDANSNLAQSKPAKSFLEAKRREFKLQDANSNLAQSKPAKTRFKNLKFGSQVGGKLSQSISWIDGEPPQIRGVINLSEDLLADDNSIALPANSLIIVEVEPQNGIINLQAIAISFKNNQGELIQESISPDIFVIQDEDGNPLTYNASGDGIPGQDILTDFIGSQSSTARRVVREVKDINERNNSRPETFELKQGTKFTITVNSL